VTKIKYVNMKLPMASLLVIRQANTIIAEYATAGLSPPTLRQLYYQFVSRGLIANNDKEYKKLGKAVANGRLAGLIDWEGIIDRTRYLRELAHWNSPEDVIRSASKQFRFDKWDNQPNYCEVWIEKDALVGVIERPCHEMDVPYLACRGYASASEVWRAGSGRIREKLADGKDCIIFYLGDHDPSGLDMSRDIQERLNLFVGDAGHVEVKRLALNIDQVKKYNPPPNPTKMSDSRAEWYVSEYGHTCWELDALNSKVLNDLVKDAIDDILDERIWDADIKRENEAKKQLADVAGNWVKVLKHLEPKKPRKKKGK
jgi:hypothetical protein